MQPAEDGRRGFFAMPKNPCTGYSQCPQASCEKSQCPVTGCGEAGTGGRPCAPKSKKPAKKKALSQEAIAQLQAQLQQKMGTITEAGTH
jgi:hypothetical protein